MTGTRRPLRDDLTGEHPLGDVGQLVLAGLFLATWVLDTFVLHYSTGANRYVPLALRLPVGIVLLGVAVHLARQGLAIVFGERRVVPTVIRKGVFGIVRHPVYLGELVLYLGLLACSLSQAAAAVWLLVALLLHRIARHEERLLLARFGADYAQVHARGPHVAAPAMDAALSVWPDRVEQPRSRWFPGAAYTAAIHTLPLLTTRGHVCAGPGCIREVCPSDKRVASGLFPRQRFSLRIRAFPVNATPVCTWFPSMPCAR